MRLITTSERTNRKMSELIPLAVAAAELNVGARELEQRHKAVICRNDAGIRCL
jgi:hypothetical protein